MMYPLTLGFGIVTVIIVVIGTNLLIREASHGVDQQLVRSFENEISTDLAREFDRFSADDSLQDINDLIVDGRMDGWYEHTSVDLGNSFFALYDMMGTPVWTNGSIRLIEEATSDHHHKAFDIALSGALISELRHNFQITDANGDPIIAEVVETHLPVFSNTDNEVIGVLETYVDIGDEYIVSVAEARSNILNPAVKIMTSITVLLITVVFVAEMLRKRAHGHRIEEERRRADADLQLIRAQTQVQELAIVEQERKRFLSVVSHELKTPLTSILAFADILTRHSDPLTERQIKHLNLVKRNGRRLDQLIGDLLDVSRIETGNFSLEFSDVPISDLFDDLTESLQGMFELKSQKLLVVNLASGRLVSADRSRIFQVISNILSNA